MACLLPVEIKLKMVLCSGLLGETILPATLAIIKILGHSILDSLEAKGNYFVDISIKNAFLIDTNSSQTSVIVQENVSPNNNLEKLARKKQQLASEKDKKKIGNSNVGLAKKKRFWFRANNNPVLLETLKFLILNHYTNISPLTY